MNTPIQKLYAIMEQAKVAIISAEIMSIKEEMLAEERELIKQAFYAGGQAYKFNTRWEKEADEYIEQLEQLVCTCKNAELEKDSLVSVYCHNCDAYLQNDR